jgi:N-acetylglutamate synthase-like GNAT family acetyltransferase
MDLEGEVIGAVTLDPVGESRPVACNERAPWALHLVVRPGERMCGVGRLIVAALEDLAREHGHDRVWVSACDAEVEFFRRCGWTESDTDPAATVLTKQLAPA